jgi:hypothetical protein
MELRPNASVFARISKPVMVVVPAASRSRHYKDFKLSRRPGPSSANLAINPGHFSPSSNRASTKVVPKSNCRSFPGSATKRREMLKSFCVPLALLACSFADSFSQTLSGRRGNPVAQTFNISAEILDEGSYQLQRSGGGLSNWAAHAAFNAYAGTNGFSDTITNAQSFYRLIRLTNAPALTHQPVGITNYFDQEVRLEVGYTGSWPIRIYWYKDGELLPSVTTNIYTFAGRTNLSGNYSVTVSNHWGVTETTPFSVKTVNPVAATVRDKRIQHVIRGGQGFITSGSFETTYGPFGYTTTSSNFNLNDQGQWQYGVINGNTGRAVWQAGGFVYPNGAWLDMTFTNFNEGTYTLQVPNFNGFQVGDFKITN